MRISIVVLTVVLACSAATHRDRQTIPAGSIPAGSTIYVDTNNGFDIFILAAFQEKRVPLKLASSRENADYILDSSLFHDSGLIATEKVASTYHISEAAFKLTGKSGDVIWAYAATKGMLSRGGGKQSVAEACAKHLKEHVVR
jgi:hypothetical protein